jgi:DNA adenine methylase
MTDSGTGTDRRASRTVSTLAESTRTPKYELLVPTVTRSAYPLMVRPFLRWAGGKRWMGRRFSGFFPKSFRRYFEPFLGSGVAFFALRPREAFLSDTNAELMNAYGVVRDSIEELLECMSLLRNTQSSFNRIRSEIPKDPIARAARFIYLNRTSWNGLYRVNRRGIFNVPYGHNDRRLVDVDVLRNASSSLKKAKLRTCDFERAIASVAESDFVYADPPYATMGTRRGFLLYGSQVFDWTQQLRLSKMLERVDEAGGIFLLSNADDDDVSELYSRFHCIRLKRASVIAGDKSARRPITELLVANYPISAN